MTTELKNRSIEIAKSAKEIGKAIHLHNMAITRHIIATRDVTLATHFVTLLMNNKDGESRSIVRADAVKNWFEAFGFCTWAKTKDGKAGFKLAKTALDSLSDPDEMKAHIKLASANPWNVYTKAKPFQIFDLEAAIKSLVKRAEDKANETGPNGEHHKVNTVVLESLKALAA